MLIIVLHKPDEYLVTFSEDKVGLTHKICSDSPSTPNIEFIPFDLKSIYHQIHDDFKEIYWNDKDIKTSSAIFQCALEKILRNIIENIIIYDIFLGVTTKKKNEHKTKFY